MKKSIVVGLVAVIIIWGAVLKGRTEEAPEIDLEAEGAVLMNAQTGELLYQKNRHQRMAPASIVKIMTMLLTMEAIEEGQVNWDDKIRVSERAAAMGGSQIWLEPGEVMELKDLLKAVAIVSANDACVAIAEHVYGTEEKFVEVMNKKAQNLGMKNTRFYNTNGLPVEGEGKRNYTTPYDVALMSWELLNYPQILEYTSIWIDSLRDGESFLRNTNDLVRFYRGTDGIKTGHTDKAGFCLAATARREGMRFISVVMDAPTSDIRFEESKELLSYAFNRHRSVLIAEEGEEVGRVNVFRGAQKEVNAVAGADLRVVVKKGEGKELVKKSKLKDEVIGPVEKGEKIGEVVVFKDGREMERIDLVADSKVEKANFIEVLAQLFELFVQQLV